MFRGLGQNLIRDHTETAGATQSVNQLLSSVYRELRPHHFELDGQAPNTALRQLVMQVLHDQIPQAPREEKEQLVMQIIHEMTGYGPLEYLMQKRGVSDIQAIGPNTIHYTCEGKRSPFVDAVFRDEAHCRQFVHRLAIQCGRTFDESTREVDLDLPDGSRLHALKTASGTVMTIRRPSLFPDFSFLLDKGIVTEEAIAFLKAIQRRRLSWIASGNTGSMKTTLIQLLLSPDCVPPSRIVGIMEEKRELRPALPYVISMEEVLPRGDGQGGYQLRQYVRAAMRMYLDVMVIGELRGPEALDALRAANSGHQMISSVHAGTPEQALAALKTLSLTAEQVPERVVDDLIAEGVRIIVQMERAEGRGGYQMYMKSISEVSMEGRDLIARPIFQFQEDGVNEDGLPSGQLRFVGMSERLIQDFASWGMSTAAWGGNKNDRL